MKQANLISIVDGFKSLDDVLFKNYLSYHCIKIKNDEMNDIEKFVDAFKQYLSLNYQLLDKYFIGYSIPQISKEFDLLRISDNSIVNIEIKSISDTDKIKNQLVRNKYYLSFLNKETFFYTYEANTNKLYKLNIQNNELLEVSFTELASDLSNQEEPYANEIDNLFNPSSYLVSPFNSTEAFLRGEYFLTQQQELIKNTLLKQINGGNTAILAIKGTAGTGKTLLTYDIAKNDLENTLIIHCGILNDGHNKLNDNGYNIIAAKELRDYPLSDYKVIIIDEAQRIYKRQFEDIISYVKENDKTCIFSYDGKQTLHKNEKEVNIPSKITNELTFTEQKLKNKIRTNESLSSFILCLLNDREPIIKKDFKNVDLVYLDKDIKNYLSQVAKDGWAVVNYTPSRSSTKYEKYKLDSMDSAHQVIGQEFDNVIVVIDGDFKYSNENGNLFYTERAYYDVRNMLFQIITRARKRIRVVIFQNKKVLERCMNILAS